jgi:hypothetical protein
MVKKVVFTTNGKGIVTMGSNHARDSGDKDFYYVGDLTFEFQATIFELIIKGSLSINK